jgi:hypothetical protein
MFTPTSLHKYLFLNDIYHSSALCAKTPRMLACVQPGRRGRQAARLAFSPPSTPLLAAKRIAWRRDDSVDNSAPGNFVPAHRTASAISSVLQRSITDSLACRGSRHLA